MKKYPQKRCIYKNGPFIKEQLHRASTLLIPRDAKIDLCREDCSRPHFMFALETAGLGQRHIDVEDWDISIANNGDVKLPEMPIGIPLPMGLDYCR